ncbi:MAG TPA: RidA family protein [Chitinophagaceae bacterium]|nr:RidA family protein [Chitinophagaceae bacterium]
MKYIIALLLLVSTEQILAQKKPSLVTLSNPPSVYTPKGYSHAAVIDLGNSKMIIISGQVAYNTKSELVGANDFEKQTEQVFTNLKNILEAHGGNMDNMVKIGVFITDTVNIPIFREVRNRYMDVKNLPPSTALVVKELFSPGLLIEVEATAIIPK